jgi:hypothetical protein
MQKKPFKQFIQIPGPNPIIVPGDEGEWDDHLLEACDIFKDGETYYFYYHATSKNGRSYEVGVATAPHPMGPWTKPAENPVLTLGAGGAWDDYAVACALIHKEGLDTYYMYYSGKSKSTGPGDWSVGLAKAPHPLGPWKKISLDAPLIDGFGYVGGMVNALGKYWMYNEHPISSTGDDYGTMSLATAYAPEGPWTIHDEGPILGPGEWGAWDDGGFSESKVFYRDGIFHLFYGGVKLDTPRFSSRESIGYAYSFDGIHFTKFEQNPVALRERNPDAAAFAEVHSYYEPPFVYLFHTLRYSSRLDPNPYEEELGIQVLATEQPFCLPMPVMQVENLAPSSSSALESCPPVSLEHISQASLSIRGTFGSEATVGAPSGAPSGLTVHVLASSDGMAWDTQSYAEYTLECKPGELCRRTVSLDPSPRFIRLRVENLDTKHAIGAVELTVVLKG